MSEKQLMEGDKRNKEEIDLKAMADAFVDSSKRSRYIIIVIVFTSVIAFIAFWNTLQHSWIRDRVRVAYYALHHRAWELYELKPATVDTLAKVWAMNRMDALSIHIDSLADSTVLNNLDTLYGRGLDSLPELKMIESLDLDTLFPLFKREKAESSKLSNIDSLFILFRLFKKDKVKAREVANIDTSIVDSLFTLVALYKEEKDLFRQAQRLCRYREFDEEALSEYAKHLDRIRTERVLMIPIPIFGVMVDVNDLGLLGGLSFTVLLLWFRFGLWKELTNLRIVFDRAKAEQKLKPCYHYLAMRQMLTIPRTLPWGCHRLNEKPQRDKEDLLKRIFYETPHRPRRRFWSKVEKLLFVLPLIVQLTVLIHDLSTFDLGEMTSPSYALWGLIIGFFFLVLMFVLTLRCLFLSWHTTKEWNRAAEEVENQLKKELEAEKQNKAVESKHKKEDKA